MVLPLMWTSTIFLQATGQAWQVLSLMRRCSRMYSPEIFSAPSMQVCWALKVGRAPMTLVMFMRTLVP